MCSTPECDGLRRTVFYAAWMGFNPFRPQDKSRLDVFIVVGFVLITLGFAWWGFFG